MTDAEVCKRANLERKLFSKIRAGKGYMPGKRTVIALAISLRLSSGEANDLLRQARWMTAALTISAAITHAESRDIAMTERLSALYARLLDHYGDPRWWPAGSSYEMMVGAVLTQNTAWSNVEKAIANFGGGLSPQAVAKTDPEELKEIIRPAGFHTQKAGCLKALTAWYGRYGYDVEQVRQQPLAGLRGELLALRGIGPETADAILLYAFGFPTFVVDAYTMRLCGRYPLDAGGDYHAVKCFFERHTPRDALLYNRFHALIVIHAKAHCRKKPLCAGCPLQGTCQRQGL